MSEKRTSSAAASDGGSNRSAETVVSRTPAMRPVPNRRSFFGPVSRRNMQLADPSSSGIDSSNFSVSVLSSSSSESGHESVEQQVEFVVSANSVVGKRGNLNNSSREIVAREQSNQSSSSFVEISDSSLSENNVSSGVPVTEDQCNESPLDDSLALGIQIRNPSQKICSAAFLGEPAQMFDLDLEKGEPQ